MSLVGNTFQRMTAKKIHARIETGSSVSVAALVGLMSNSSESLTLLNAQRGDEQGLAHVVDKHMLKLELADALDSIMDMLTKVCSACSV